MLSFALKNNQRIGSKEDSYLDIHRLQLYRNLVSIHSNLNYYVKFDLYSANLQDANLADAILHNADLMNANLQDANLEGANLTGANIPNDVLSGAIGTESTLPEAHSPVTHPSVDVLSHSFKQIPVLLFNL